jgi:hypothetical protein
LAWEASSQGGLGMAQMCCVQGHPEQWLNCFQKPFDASGMGEKCRRNLQCRGGHAEDKKISNIGEVLSHLSVNRTEVKGVYRSIGEATAFLT